MNQEAGLGPLQTRCRPALAEEYEYGEFSLFLPPLEEGGFCKFASRVHSVLFCAKQKNNTPMHTYSAITSNKPFYPPSSILLSSTFPPHQLTLRTRSGKAWSWLAISWDRLSQEFPASGSARHSATADTLAVFWHLHSSLRPRPRNASEKNTF